MNLEMRSGRTPVLIIPKQTYRLPTCLPPYSTLFTVEADSKCRTVANGRGTMCVLMIDWRWDGPHSKLGNVGHSVRPRFSKRWCIIHSKWIVNEPSSSPLRGPFSTIIMHSGSLSSFVTFCHHLYHPCHTGPYLGPVPSCCYVPLGPCLNPGHQRRLHSRGAL